MTNDLFDIAIAFYVKCPVSREVTLPLNSASVTDVVPGLGDIVAIAGGYSTHLALKQDGTLISINAELPDWIDESAEQSTIPAGLKDIVAIYSKASQAAFRNRSVPIT